MAETDGFDSSAALHVAGQHSHRISVIEKERVRAHFFHVPCKILHDRDGAQRAHDPADPEGVADRLAQAVFFRDFKIDDCGGGVTSHLDGIDDERGPAQGSFAVFNAEVTFDASVSSQCGAHGFQDRAALFEPCPVDVVQGKDAVAQDFAAHTVTDNISRENSASGTYKCDLHVYLHVEALCK